MKKQFMAILAALLITACIGASLFAIGGAALVNRNTTTASDSSTQLTAISDSNLSQPDQLAQLQDLVAQYQDREQQYQQREQQLKDQLVQSNAQIQQDQQLLQQVQILLAALQQRGLISVTNDGRILINQ
jgi:TolA-binding protein